MKDDCPYLLCTCTLFMYYFLLFGVLRKQAHMNLCSLDCGKIISLGFACCCLSRIRNNKASLERGLMFYFCTLSENSSKRFYNWNRVKIRYCDGDSFSGDSQNEDSKLYFRGQHIWLAAMEELMSQGMRHANQALLSGCSAGSLATILHCDEFRSLFPRTTRVKCISDAGLFLDAVDVAGHRTTRSLFAGLVHLQLSSVYGLSMQLASRGSACSVLRVVLTILIQLCACSLSV